MVVLVAVCACVLDIPPVVGVEPRAERVASITRLEAATGPTTRARDVCNIGSRGRAKIRKRRRAVWIDEWFELWLKVAGDDLGGGCLLQGGCRVSKPSTGIC